MLNFGVVALAQSLTPSDTVIRYVQLANGVSFENSVGCRVVIARPYLYPLGNDPLREICVITAADADTITVTRAQEGTIATAKDLDADQQRNFFIAATLTAGEIATFENVPTGGERNELLKKNSASNYDAGWESLYELMKLYLDANSFTFNDGTQMISVPELTETQWYQFAKNVIRAGSNVTVSGDDVQETVTISSTGGGGGGTGVTYTLHYDNAARRLRFTPSSGSETVIDLSGLQTAQEVSTAITNALNNASLGNVNLFETGTPTTQGEDGDTYFDTNNGKAYKKISGSWMEQADFALQSEIPTNVGSNQLYKYRIQKLNADLDIQTAHGTITEASGVYSATVTQADNSVAFRLFEPETDNAGTLTMGDTIYVNLYGSMHFVSDQNRDIKITRRFQLVAEGGTPNFDTGSIPSGTIYFNAEAGKELLIPLNALSRILTSSQSYTFPSPHGYYATWLEISVVSQRTTLTETETPIAGSFSFEIQGFGFETHAFNTTLFGSSQGGGGVSPTAENVFPIVADSLVAGTNVTIDRNNTARTLTINSTASGGGGGGTDTTYTFSFANNTITITPSSGAAQTIDLSGYQTIDEVTARIRALVPDYVNMTRLPHKSTTTGQDYSVIVERFGGTDSRGALTLQRDDGATISNTHYFASHDVMTLASTSITGFANVPTLSTLGAKRTSDGVTIPFVIGIRPLSNPNGGIDIYTPTSRIADWGNRLNVELEGGSYDESFDASTSGNWLPHGDVMINGEAVSVLSVRDSGASVPNEESYSVTIEAHSSQTSPTFIWNPNDSLHITPRTSDTNTNVMNVTTTLYRKATTTPTNLTNADIASMDINASYQIQNLPTDTSRNGYDLATNERLYQCEVRIVKDLVANTVLHREATHWQEVDAEVAAAAESRANNSQIYAEFFRIATPQQIESSVSTTIFSKRLVNDSLNQVQESANLTKLYDIHSTSSHWQRNVDLSALVTGTNLYRILVAISIGTGAAGADEVVVVTQPQVVDRFSVQEKRAIDHISDFANHFTPVNYDATQTFLAPDIFNSLPTQNRPDTVQSLAFEPTNELLYVLGSDSFITRLRLTNSNSWQLSRIPRPTVDGVTQAHVRGITVTDTHIFTVEESDVDGTIKRFSVTRFSLTGSQVNSILLNQTIPSSQFIKDIVYRETGGQEYLRILISGQAGATYVRDAEIVNDHISASSFSGESRVGETNNNGSIGLTAEAQSCYFYNDEWYVTYRDTSTRRFPNAHLLSSGSIPLQGSVDTHTEELGNRNVVQADLSRPPSAVGTYVFLGSLEGGFLQISRRTQIKIVELTDVDDDLTDNAGQVVAIGNSNNVSTLTDQELKLKVLEGLHIRRPLTGIGAVAASAIKFLWDRDYLVLFTVNAMHGNTNGHTTFDPPSNILSAGLVHNTRSFQIDRYVWNNAENKLELSFLDASTIDADDLMAKFEADKAILQVSGIYDHDNGLSAIVDVPLFTNDTATVTTGRYTGTPESNPVNLLSSELQLNNIRALQGVDVHTILNGIFTNTEDPYELRYMYSTDKVLEVERRVSTQREQAILSAQTTGLDQAQVDARIVALRPNAFTNAQQTKLSGIETAATADQTGAEMKTALEGLAAGSRLSFNSLDNAVHLTQAAYDALTPDANTTYFVSG